ncbi:MAG TPA: glutamate--tRNA ligase [Candidatus Omnitrophota bacterium]|nr:glutamate--tRNA ligase [Candidatus Omnitrophota bacterium]
MIRVRFAPSPTGHLHIGNARTALFNFLFAAGQGGIMILRIEDTDPERSREEMIGEICKDLNWLGLEWSEGPDVGGAFGPYRQSQRFHLYREAAGRLVKEGKAYPCYCTEEELEEKKKRALAEGKTPRYDGRCRGLSADERAKLEAKGLKPVIRFKVDPGEVVFRDLIREEVRVDPSLYGDFVIVRQDGSPTFHLSVCVDDGMMNITHVIRGEDHLSNTPRHILLFKALGFEIPQFAHLSLIAGKGGELLSKRLGAMSLSEYRTLGYPPEALVNYLALLGWSPPEGNEILTPEELKKMFNLLKVHHSAACFDFDKLNWLSGEHLRRISDAEFVSRARPYYTGPGTLPDEAFLLFKDNLRCFSEINEKLSVFDPGLEVSENDLGIAREAKDLLAGAAEFIRSEGTASYEKMMGVLKQKTGRKGKTLFMPLRLALTGKEHGPEMARLIPLLGAELCLKRLEKAILACAG